MKSKSKIIVPIVCIAVLAILGVFAFAKTDLFKSPKDLFFKYLGDALEIEEEFDYNQFLEEYKKVSKNSYDMTTTISTNIKSDDIEDEIVDAISNSKIIINQKANPKENKIYESLEYKYKDNEGIKAELLESDNQYAVKSDILHDKYLSIENKNLKELFKKFGIESEEIPDEIKMMDTYEFLYISPKDVNTIKQTYKDVIDKNISKDCYSVEKNVEVSVNGEKMKTNAYTLNITGKQLYNLGINILETLKSDDLTLGIIEAKLEMLYENALIQEDEKYTKDEIRELIDEMIEDYKSSAEYVSEEDNIKITVYVSDGKTVKMVIVPGEDGTISFDKMCKDNHNVYVIDVKDSEESVGKVTIDYTLDKKGNEKKATGTVTVKSSDDESYKFNFDIQKTGNDDKYDLKISLGTTIEEIKLNLNIDSSVNLNAKVELDSLNSETAVKINDLDEEKLQSLLEEIMSNIETRLPEKLQKLGLDEEFLNSLIEEGSSLVSGSSDDSYTFDDEDSDSDDMEEQYNAILEKYQNGELTLTEASEQIEELYR